MTQNEEQSYYNIIYDDGEEIESSSCKCWSKLIKFIGQINLKLFKH